uniref:Uncharacterized protein n=1 Tax=Molossus molossus TaxID=27622 RepID=A0A7J8HGZ7_MOLMO|nr:hypothetical protein HJG59_010952 [Molossus molossus]
MKVRAGPRAGLCSPHTFSPEVNSTPTPHSPDPTRGRMEQIAEQKHSDSVDTIIIIPAITHFVAGWVLGRARLVQANLYWQSDPKALSTFSFHPPPYCPMQAKGQAASTMALATGHHQSPLGHHGVPTELHGD